MKALYSILLCIAILLVPSISLAASYGSGSNFVTGQRKISNGNAFNAEVLRVLALPVTDFGVDFYYKVESYDSRLTETDLNRISGLVDKAVSKSFDKLVKALEALVKQIEKAANNGSGNTQPLPPSVPYPVPNTGSNGNGNGNGGTSQNGTIEVPVAVNKIMSTKCLTCHSTNNPQGKLNLEKYTMLVNGKWAPIDRSMRWDIFDTVHTGSMPKNGQPLSDEEVEIIRNWARQK